MARDLFKTNFRWLPLLGLTSLLGACGGGGDDDVDAGFEGGTDASGIWIGMVDVDGRSDLVPAVLIIEPDGRIHLDGNIALLSGAIGTNGTAFSGNADGYSFEEAFPDGSDFSLNGNVTKEDSLDGAFSGGSSSGTFTFEYDAGLSTLTAALATIAGTYEGDLWIHEVKRPLTITLMANGTFTGDDGAGCGVSGTASVLNASRNLYQWTATVSGCTAKGAASGIGFGRNVLAAEDGIGFHYVGKVDGGAIHFTGFNAVP